MRISLSTVSIPPHGGWLLSPSSGVESEFFLEVFRAGSATMFGVACCESKTELRGYFSSDPWSWNLNQEDL
jgi:hypothetical protein